MTDFQRQSRRDFLQGRAAAQAVAGALSHAGGLIGDVLGKDASSLAFEDNSQAAVGRTQPLISVRRRAMACEFEVQIASGSGGQCLQSVLDGQRMQCVLDALDLVESLEAQMTVYRADSDVLRINRQAAARAVPVEPRLLALFQLAERLHRETNGALDLTSGPLSEVWGFSRRAGRMPSDEEVAAALERVGMEQVALDTVNSTVAFRRPGVSLHLNCIGKGYALDRMAEQLNTEGVDDYLLHGGRSSVLARGNCPGGESAGWAIGLRHPLRPEERLGEFVLVNQALGTSGSATQSFEHNGRRYGHLLDPRTGRPAEGVFTATVLAPTAAEADALSTAFYILGPEKTGEYCATRPDVAAVLVCPQDGDQGICVHALNADETRWRPAVGR